MTFTLGNLSGLLPSHSRQSVYVAVSGLPQCSTLPLTWPATFPICVPYFLTCLLLPRLGTLSGFICFLRPYLLNQYTVGPHCLLKKHDPGLPVSQSQRRQLLSAEPVRTCLVSPAEGVKKRDQVHLSPTESPPCSAPEGPPSSLTSEHSNLINQKQTCPKCLPNQ